MTFANLIADAIRQLDTAGVPYMVTGSVASSYYGEPRTTRDLDIVIDPNRLGLEAFVNGLIADGSYDDPDAARAALAERTQFNAIGPGAFKVDFVIKKARPFSIIEFERRRPADLMGTAAFIPSVEDLIIAKLEWAAESGSERQRRDVANMLAVSRDEIDQDYLRHWVVELDLEAIWHEVTGPYAVGR